MNTKTLPAAQYIFASLSGCCTSRIFKGCLQSNCINLPLLHHLIRSQMGLPSVVCMQIVKKNSSSQYNEILFKLVLVV